MKTKLVTKQSQHLIDLGVPKEKATEVMFNPNNDDYDFVFSLEDFLNGEILPKEIETENGKFYLDIQMTNEICSVSYKHIDHHGGWIAYYVAKELINALYLLTYWYYGEFLKSEKKC